MTNCDSNFMESWNVQMLPGCLRCLALKSNNSGRTGLFSLSLTHGGSNSLGGGESERFVFLFPNKLWSTYEGENLTGL